MKAILNIGPLQLDDPQNYDHRAEIMWACKITHDNSLGEGRQVDWACHLLGHQISAVCDLAHGASLAIMFLAWTKYVYKDHLDRFYKFAANVFDVPPTVMSKELTCLEGIRRLEEWTKRLGLPTTLTEAKVDRMEAASTVFPKKILIIFLSQPSNSKNRIYDLLRSTFLGDNYGVSD